MAFLTSSLELTSSAFTNNGIIPLKYTFRGENVNPPLQISNIPYGTRSMVLIMEAAVATRGGDGLHWLLYNIPREVTEISENNVPTGVLQGVIGTGRTGYSGPNPLSGSGIRQYIFKLFAIPIIFELENGADRMTIERLLGETNIVAQTQLVGLFNPDTPQTV